MSPLIEGLCSQLTPDIIKQCKDIGILTVTAFVSENPEELSKKTKVPYKDLICIRHSLLSTYASFPQRADNLYRMLLESICIISSGSKRIDMFLKGGIYTGEVTEIYGPPGSGKTQFTLSVSASLLLDSGNTVLYLDTKNNFSASRICQILANRSGDKMILPEKLKYIQVLNVDDIYHLLAILDSVKCELSIKEKEFFVNLKLVVLDSITNLLSPCFGGKYLDGACFMSNIAQFFKCICTQHMVSMLVCNNTVQSTSEDIKAGLGPNWKYLPSVSLCIKPIIEMNDAKHCKLRAVKSCRNGLFNEANFIINDAGISD